MFAKPELSAQTRAPKMGQSLQLITSISQTVQKLEEELKRVRPLKDAFRQSLEYALRHSTARSLQGCALEVVGSTSWGGDVPHSDLDIVLLTPAICASRSQMLVVLRDLQQSLESSQAKYKAQSTWQRLELLDTARVPILRVHCIGDLHCDVSVDQLHALAHRDFMWSLSNSRPQIRDIIRLVKMWLHRRAIPVASDGGLPSLAWSIIVLRFVQAWPDDTSVATLLCEFFREMQQLTDHSLTVRRRRAETGLNKEAESTGSHLEWLSRGGLPISWAESWIPLVNVEDPTQLGVSSPTAITLPSIPAALGVLYVGELRLAWNSILRGRWHEFWQPAPWAPVQRCLMGKGKLHVVLTHGEVRVGQLRDVSCFMGSPGADLLNRRDQGSKLSLQQHGLHVAHGTKGAQTVICATACDGWISCHPCHLVCALPAGPAMMLLDEGLSILLEIVKLVGSRSVCPQVYEPVLTWRRRYSNCSQRNALSSSEAFLQLDGLARPTQPGLVSKQWQNFSQEELQKQQQQRQQQQERQQQRQQQPQATRAADGLQFTGLASPLQPGLQIPKFAKAPDSPKAPDNTMAAFSVAMHKQAIAAAQATALAIIASRAAGSNASSIDSIIPSGKPSVTSSMQHPQAQKVDKVQRSERPRLVNKRLPRPETLPKDRSSDDAREAASVNSKDGDCYSHCELGDESTCVDSSLTSDSDLESFGTYCTTSECASRPSSRRKGRRTQIVYESRAAHSIMPSAAKSPNSLVAWKPTLRCLEVDTSPVAWKPTIRQLSGIAQHGSVEQRSRTGSTASCLSTKAVQGAKASAALHRADTILTTAPPIKASSLHIECSSDDVMLRSDASNAALVAKKPKKHLNPSCRSPVWKPRLGCTQDIATCQKPSCDEKAAIRVHFVSEFEHTPAALHERTSFLSLSSSNELSSTNKEEANTFTLDNEIDTGVRAHCMSLDSLEACDKTSFADVVRRARNS